MGEAKRISYLQRKIPRTKHKQTSKQQNSTQAHQMLAHERWRTWISCLFPWCLGHTSKHGKSPSQPKRRPTGAQCGERSCTVLAETQMAEWCDAAGHCWSIGLDSASSWSCPRTYEADRTILKERDVTLQPLPTLSNGTGAGTQGPAVLCQ